MRPIVGIVCLVLAVFPCAPRAAEVESQPEALSFTFHRNSPYVSEYGLLVLDDVTIRLQTDRDLIAVVDGHADEAERPAVARRRARAARDYLVAEKGIEPDRVVPRAFGDRYPVGTAAENARVEIALVHKGGAPAAGPTPSRTVARAPWSGPPRDAPRAPGHGRGPRAILQTGHAGAVLAIAFSQDGRFVLTGGDDATARLWNRAIDAEVQTFEGHTGPVLAVACSADGRLVATGASDGTASVWDLVTGAELGRIAAHGSGVAAVAFSADGRRLATGGRDGVTRIFDTAGCVEAQRLETQLGAVTSVAFSADGERVLTACDDGVARVWSAATGARVAAFEGHARAVTFAAFLTGDRRAVTASDDATIRVWDAATGNEVRQIATGLEQISTAAVSPDGRLALASGWGAAVLLNLETGAVVRRVMVDDDALALSSAFAPDGKRVAIGLDRVARVSDVATGNGVERLGGAVEPIHAAATNRDTQYVVAGLDAGNSRVLDLRANRQVLRLPHSGDAREVHVSPAGDFVAVLSGTEPHPGDVGEASLDLDIWRLPSGAVVRKEPRSSDRPPSRGPYRLESSDRPVGCRSVELDESSTYRVVEDAVSGACLVAIRCLGADLSPDGRRLVTRHWPGEIWLREPATGRPLVRLDHEFGGEMSDPCFVDGGRLVVAGGGDRNVRAWSAATGRPQWTRPMPPEPPALDDEEERVGRADDPSPIDVEPSDDGRFVLAYDGLRYFNGAPIRLLRVETGSEVWTFSPRSWTSETEQRTPDGHLALVYGSRSGDGPGARVVDVASRKEVWGAELDEAAFSPDGRFVLGREGDSTATLRDAATGRELWRTGFPILHVTFSGDERFVLAATGYPGLVWLDAKTGSALAAVHFFDDGSWAVLDPAGARWDGPDAAPPRGLVFADGTTPLSPAEVRRFREPRLLAQLLRIGRSG